MTPYIAMKTCVADNIKKTDFKNQKHSNIVISLSQQLGTTKEAPATLIN